MTKRRPLGDTLGDLVDVGGMLSAGAGSALQVRSMDLELPLDIRFALEGRSVVLVGDLPQFLTRTAFDPEPARLSISFVAQPGDES